MVCKRKVQRRVSIDAEYMYINAEGWYSILFANLEKGMRREASFERTV